MNTKKNIKGFMCNAMFGSVSIGRFVKAENEVEAAKRFASEFITRYPDEAVDLKHIKVNVESQCDGKESYQHNAEKKFLVFNVRPVIRTELVATLDRVRYDRKL